MLTLFGIKVSYDTILSVVFFALFFWSEYLGGNKKIKQNNVAQYVYSYLRLKRQEDDKLSRILGIIKGK